MPAPGSPRSFVLLLFLLIFLFAFIQVQAISLVFTKLGLSPQGAAMLLFSSLFGSLINLPLFQINNEFTQSHEQLDRFKAWGWQPGLKAGKTVIAINVGGGLIPILFSIYLIQINAISPAPVLLAILLISLISFFVSRPIAGLGIGMPIFIAPISAAMLAILIQPELASPLAYIGGTLGVLIGADLLRLRDIRNMHIPMASIGGAGTFDGIFLTGIIAVLLT